MTHRFLHLTATTRGGAGLAALRLHETVQTAGHESLLLTLKAEAGSEGAPLKLAAPWRRAADKVWARTFSDARFYFQRQHASYLDRPALIARACHFDPTAIVAHYLSGFCSFDEVAAVSEATGAPVIWNLLDMGALTGGCHYAWQCGGYAADCGECPALRNSGPSDTSRRIHTAKREALTRFSSGVVCASSTLAAQAERSSLFRNHPRRIIPIAPPEIDLPTRLAARQALGLDEADTVLFFGAQKLDDPRKGGAELRDALALVAQTRDAGDLPVILSAGGSDLGWSPGDHGYRHMSHGKVSPAALWTFYRAADVFVCPSVEDSGPMMINEAIKAGTPVISFAVGVAPDLVLDGQTGIVAPETTASALAEAVTGYLLLPAAARLTLREHCSQLASERLSMEAQGRAFAAFASDLSARGARSHAA
jgi:glycosyltransferase involved in cell wall biosynthesis